MNDRQKTGPDWDAFNAAYVPLIDRPITNREIAWRCFQAGRAALAVQPGAVGEWVSLTDDDRRKAFESLPDMLDGFLKKWGWLHFAKAIEELCRAKNAAAPTEAKPAQDAVDAEQIKKAMNQAFVMGQNYWHDADSESYAANKRSDVTRQKFNEMRDELCAAISAKKGG